MWKWLASQELVPSTEWRWAPGEPNGQHERCVQFWGDSAEWNDNSCTVKTTFICQIAASVEAPVVQAGYCNPGYTSQSDGRCYKHIGHGTQEVAASECVKDYAQVRVYALIDCRSVCLSATTC